MNPGDVLRQAATVMRRRANAATPGPWSVDNGRSIVGAEGAKPKLAGHVVCSVGAYNLGLPTDADAEHIASWHPGVAVLVADLLDKAATEYVAEGDRQWTDCATADAAHTAARTYLASVGDEP